MWSWGGVQRLCAIAAICAIQTDGAQTDEPLRFPTPEQQAETFAPFRELLIQGRTAARFLREHKVILFTQVDKVTALPEGRFSIKSGSIACAAPISADGYLLTVSHGIHDPVYALVMRDRRPHVIKTVTVWDGNETNGCDLAVLKIPWTFAAPCHWADDGDLQKATAVLSSGAYLVDADATTEHCREDHGAGRIAKSLSHISAAGGTPAFSLIESRLLVHPGDSGGPVMTLTGRLAGVTLGHVLDGSGVSTGATIVIRPDLAWLDALVSSHRSRGR